MLHDRKTILWMGALGILVLDQITKWIILNIMHPPHIIPVTDFFNIVLVWNRGVSFGLFQAGTLWQTLLLVGLALVVVGILLGWFRKTTRPWTQWSIALIIGGAIGNIIDRVRFGAVVDFLDFYIGNWHWPAFNVADCAIVIGVFMLILDDYVGKKDEHTS